MRILKLMALPLFIGAIQGCDMNTPSAPTPAQILKADAKSQGAMREYYGNMLTSNAKPKSKSKAKAKAKGQGQPGEGH